MKLSLSRQPRNTLRVVSFQKHDVIDQLMSTDILTIEDYGQSMREDKTRLYQNILGIETCPFYSFASLLSCNDCIGSPISLATISLLWSSLRGYYRLDGRSILEMEIPESEGVLGLVDDLKTVDSIWDTDEPVELVTPYVKREWIREIYHPDCDATTYGRITYQSTLNSDPYAMFKGACDFSGSSSYNDEHMWKEFRTGFTLAENLQRMLTAVGRKHLVNLAGHELGMEVDRFDNKGCRDIILILGDYLVEESV